MDLCFIHFFASVHRGKKTPVALVMAAFSTEPEKIPAEWCATAGKRTYGRVHSFLRSLSNTFEVTQSCCVCVGACLAGTHKGRWWKMRNERQTCNWGKIGESRRTGERGGSKRRDGEKRSSKHSQRIKIVIVDGARCGWSDTDKWCSLVMANHVEDNTHTYSK